MTDRGQSSAKLIARAAARAAIARIGPAEHAAWSALVRDRLEAIEAVRTARVVMGFWALGREPDVLPLLAALLGRGAVVALPRVDWEGHSMLGAAVGDLSRDVVRSRHGVVMPSEACAPVDPGEIDVVLVPGLAFDEQRWRIGRGGGYYDRFLADPSLRAARLGVCFEAQIAGDLPREPHDARVDAVVTERRTISG